MKRIILNTSSILYLRNVLLQSVISVAETEQR